MDKINSLGIYIHVPYCKKACSYCDFYFSTSTKSISVYINAIKKELEYYSILLPNHIISNIYFGGGTPSRLNIFQLNMLFSFINESFEINPEAECTIEMNPDDFMHISLDQLFQIGFNRISLGIQSFEKDELRWMNRSHTLEQSFLALDKIKASDFQNFSIDLIYATPYLTNKQWILTLEQALNYQPPHISAYALTIEEKTKLNYDVLNKKIPHPNEDKFVDQFNILVSTLSAKKYIQYEISNFSLENYQAKHNSSYWEGKSYLGLGPSAHSFIHPYRWHNIKNVWNYCKSIDHLGHAVQYKEKLSKDEELTEYILTKLRTDQGISISKLFDYFDYNILAIKRNEIHELITKNYISINNNQITLLYQGKLISDFIIYNLLP